jgi:hypothetical protein
MCKGGGKWVGRAEVDEPVAANERIGIRSRKVPSGRAVAGGALVAAAAVLVFTVALASSRPNEQRYVVSARPLAAQTILGPGDLTTATMQLPKGAASGAFVSVGAAMGRALAVEMQPGELLESSMLVPTASAPVLRPVSVQAAAGSLQGLEPGQRVDVLEVATSSGSGGSGAGGTATGAIGSGSGGSGASVVVRGAVLLASSVADSAAAVGDNTAEVTLGVSTLAEVEAVVGAAAAEAVVLVAAEPSDGSGLGPGDAP